MKRKKYIFAIAAILIWGIVIISFIFQQNKLNGSTLESREFRLNQSDNGIHITSEIKIDEPIISGIVGANNKYGPAIFELEDNNKYRLQTNFLKDNGEIITGHTVINEIGYDLFWYNQADLDYAKITYTVQGKKLEPIKLDAKENKILYHKAPSNDYSIEVTFYDTQGNQYEGSIYALSAFLPLQTPLPSTAATAFEAATLTERITHYTLLRKVVCQGASPFGIPGNKTGCILPLREHTALLLSAARFTVCV